MLQSNKDMKWKTLSSKYLFQRPWLTARVDKVELPTGSRNRRILRFGIYCKKSGDHSIMVPAFLIYGFY